MMNIQQATVEDASEILALQKLAYQSEAEIYNDFTIQPLQQSLEELIREINEEVVLKLCREDRIIGSVRAFAKEATCYIGKLIVHPEFQGHGLGSQLIKAIEAHFHTKRFELFTGCRSERNLHLYKKHGYQIFDERPVNGEIKLIYLEKRVQI